MLWLAPALATPPTPVTVQIEMSYMGVTQDGDFRSLPCHLAELGGLDGFYACRLRRST